MEHLCICCDKYQYNAFSTFFKLDLKFVEKNHQYEMSIASHTTKNKGTFQIFQRKTREEWSVVSGQWSVVSGQLSVE